ncbi:glycoside hydrolase domain-containing protein [Flexithrix dorotheae]|uniref:glycoside hydrolase domain-containing protein n=1 Tax=Flexithrix dorotheae TaxID=70993 RepID=UPI0003A90584|nr:glycoside hydrolase domain-containing protein [Flexithrix dorotheae]
MRLLLIYTLILVFNFSCSQRKQDNQLTEEKAEPASLVNAFLGTSGDHGQMSPAASYPFSMLSIGPHTYPSTHTGYEYYAKEFLGFSHNRFEGVGCQGSGGNILVKPFIGDSWENSKLMKTGDSASPGYYRVAFTNQLSAEFTVVGNYGMHHYEFPEGEKGLYFDLGHSIVNRFRAEAHHIEGNSMCGWIEARTTCGDGQYKIYYYMEVSQSVEWVEVGEHQVLAQLKPDQEDVEIHLALSSVNVEYAKNSVKQNAFLQMKAESNLAWNKLLSHIEVKGDQERKELFYSYLYRAIQSPYMVNEEDGYYRAVDGSVQQSDTPIYNGWAIWDNYRTQLPLLSIVYPERFKDIAGSIANLYAYGKKDFATENEPSPTVRTEHAIVVLLDAYRKGVNLDFDKIADSLISEVEKLPYNHPDEALEASYDAWALSQILDTLGQKTQGKKFLDKALNYKSYWMKDFKDLSKNDVDRMGARGMYQGTVWQYRWFVPFDQNGLMDLTGGEKTFLAELDEFFEGDYYNHANQPDLQTTGMYQGTSQPWKSQAIIHKIAVDTVVQHYFNNNSRGTGSFVGRIYKNDPATYLPTMDDDAGTMSSWYVWASCGLFPACIGEPVYYLHAPLLEEIKFNWENGKSFLIKVENYNPDHAYIQQATFNGKPLERNWLTHQEIMSGGELVITSSAKPNTSWGIQNRWISGDKY